MSTFPIDKPFIATIHIQVVVSISISGGGELSMMKVISQMSVKNNMYSVLHLMSIADLIFLSYSVYQRDFRFY
jgi:hypothetical protein